MESNGAFIWECIKALKWLGIFIGFTGIINVIILNEDLTFKFLLLLGLIFWMIIWIFYV